MQKKPESDSIDPIEITAGMIRAGIAAMAGYLNPDEIVMRAGVVEIYLAMALAQRRSAR